MMQEQEIELLDYCRIKKIFDKGFGFLSSLYYNENVFFHFSRIKDQEIRKKLEELKRGVISIYFTSTKKNGKRKVDKVWLNISDVPISYLPKFIERLLNELNDGSVNPFEIIDALSQLNEINKLNSIHLERIVSSTKIVKNPSILEMMLPKSKMEQKEQMSKLIKEKNNSDFSDITKKEIILILTN
jgi:cold shock CspA family protein